MKNRTGLAAFLALAGLAFAQENYSQWSDSRAIRVNTKATGANVAEDVTRFPLLIRLNAGNFSGFSQAAANGSDVRFTRRDGVQRCPHQIERWDAVNQIADVWVLAERVRGNDSDVALRIYWGKSGAPDSSSGAKTFTAGDGFQAVFHLNEADTIRDATSAGLKGVPVGSTPPTAVSSIVPGAFISGGHKNFSAPGTETENIGGAYRLATSAGATSANSLDYTAESAYTVCTWVNMNSFPGSGTTRRGIITKTGSAQAGNGAATSMQYHLRALNSPNFFEFTDGNVNGTTGLILDPSITTGQWNYLCYVRSTPDAAVAYQYNALAASSDPAEGSTASHQDVDVMLGAYAGNNGPGASTGTGFFDGKLDEVVFSNVARSAAWIKLSYETQKPGSTVVTLTNEAATGVFSRGDPGLRAGFSVEISGAGRLFRLPELGAGRAEVSIVDVNGRAVWRRAVERGAREVAWNGRADGGSPATRGVYFARLTFTEGAGARSAETRFLYAP